MRILSEQRESRSNFISVSSTAAKLRRGRIQPKESAMTKCLTCAFALMAATLTWNASRVLADDDDGKEEKVNVDQLPSLVKTTLLKEVGSGKIVELVKQTKGSTVTYEADFKLNGDTWELKIAADGKVIKKQIDDDDDEHEDHDDGDEDDDGPDED